MVLKIPPAMMQRSLPPQNLTGFETVRDVTVPTKRIVVSPGTCRSQDDTADISMATSMMKRLDQVWAPGSGNGGLEQGALVANVWYHCLVILNPTTGAVDILFSGSITNPLLPSGYTVFRRVWSIYTDASANIMPYVQSGDWCAWAVQINSFSSGNLGASPTIITMATPLGIKVEAQFLLLVISGAGRVGLMDPDTGDPTAVLFWPVATKISAQDLSSRGYVFTDVNSRVVGYADANMTSSVITIGYRDPRGKL
jgi:hypothetical protein